MASARKKVRNKIELFSFGRHERDLLLHAVRFANRSRLDSLDDLYRWLKINPRPNAQWLPGIHGGEWHIFRRAGRELETLDDVKHAQRWLRQCLADLTFGSSKSQRRVPRLGKAVSSTLKINGSPSIVKLGRRFDFWLRDIALVGHPEIHRGGRLESQCVPVATSIRGRAAYAVAALCDSKRPYEDDLYRCQLRDTEKVLVCGKFFWSPKTSGNRDHFCCDLHRTAQKQPTHALWKRLEKKREKNLRFLR